jgi:hypothetical protein
LYGAHRPGWRIARGIERPLSCHDPVFSTSAVSEPVSIVPLVTALLHSSTTLNSVCFWGTVSEASPFNTFLVLCFFS